MSGDTAVKVELIDGALGAAKPLRLPGAGAVVQFEGVVRPTESGRPLRGLAYEQYDPMTRRMLRALGSDMVQQFALLALRIEHSVGFVANHDVSFRLTIASAHRKESLAAMDEFIDRMKREVPLWKVPQWEQTDG